MPRKALRLRGIRDGVRRLEPQPRQPRRNDEGDRQRQQHAHARVDRDGAHVRPHQAGDEGHRQQRCDDRQRRQNRRAADFVDGAGNDLHERLAREQLLVPVNVLDDHDGVVDQDADREDQREQRNAVQREAPRPRGEQRRRQRQDHRAADDGGFAPAERQEHQCDDRRGGEQQLLDQLLRLVVGGGAVVARFGDLDVVRDDGVAQHLHATHHRVGDVDGVLARLLGDGDGHGRILAAVLARHALPDIATRRQGAVADGGHVLQEDRLAVAHADHQFRDIVGILEERAGFDGDRAIGREQVAHRQAEVGRLQRSAQVGDGHAGAGHAGRIDLDDHSAAGSANRIHLARAGDPFEIGLDAVGNPLQVKGADRGVLAEQRERDDGHVIDALGLDQRGSGRPSPWAASRHWN